MLKHAHTTVSAFVLYSPSPQPLGGACCNQVSEEEAERRASELESRLRVLDLSRAKSVQLLGAAAAKLRLRMDALKQIHRNLKQWAQAEVKGAS